ncbi:MULTISPECIES: ABC transporter permease/substrate binding protein [unclassified Rathayibacter]|jgi:glycine betaine/proline transport system substrate-binding protein|uniref:ABC transporter permease/substrate binding protein n=1 Tax=unclassified Rathayibacter TaxID=2609250 RepID=UPI000CE77110|nr:MULTISPECIES: ABC transporter permease/substrate binding protein [unclassified Rathayibacter]PPF67515.1 glycine/betaine ABC transporter permease [Rathayibacter sp. AY1E6]PPH13526.1 glycine/betaine ABC transporter permease [Rathayibacter sp. AY1F8]PPH71232.1 glycine/betaine ABC transporter permease [Rathayibacter sp. AY1D4]PPH85697.1 glycine/betaine ABC transporter permease [Rathayibacter sp. AY1D3]
MTDLGFRLPLGALAEGAVDVLTQTFQPVFDLLRTVFGALYSGVDLVLATPPFWVIVAFLAVLAYAVRGWVFAAGTAVGLLLIVGVDQWENAMDSLALVLVASVIAIALSVPLGVLAARNRTASAVIRPVLDLMQTMPAFVYLIPALILFRVGVVPGIVATIVFAMAPGVRLTELGIRGVDPELVEAGESFGSSKWRILRQIQLPLALPSILAGLNQVIMLSLSMVVIAGMVGAGGLGGDVVASLNRIDVALGFEAGISVVILAVVLDRMTGALGSPSPARVARAKNRRAVVATRSAVGVVSIGLVASLGAATLAAPATASSVDNGDRTDVTVAVFQGWDEGIAVSALWEAVLEEQGYDVTLQNADVAPGFQGLSTGDYDLALDTWLPLTHARYVEQYGDSIVDLGAWNDEAKLTIAVNEDAPIDSLEELAADPGVVGNRLIGIEPGSGLNKTTTEDVIPGYGLEGMDYLTSSTPAMLQELSSATAAGENIAVTLWRPHWAYDAFPVKDLEDPKGLLGQAEGIHSFGSAAFDADYPTMSRWIRDFRMDSKTLYSLENALFNDGADDRSAALAAWMDENREYVDTLIT